MKTVTMILGFVTLLASGCGMLGSEGANKGNGKAEGLDRCTLKAGYWQSADGDVLFFNGTTKRDKAAPVANGEFFYYAADGAFDRRLGSRSADGTIMSPLENLNQQRALCFKHTLTSYLDDSNNKVFYFDESASSEEAPTAQYPSGRSIQHEMAVDFGESCDSDAITITPPKGLCSPSIENIAGKTFTFVGMTIAQEASVAVKLQDFGAEGKAPGKIGAVLEDLLSAEPGLDGLNLEVAERSVSGEGNAQVTILLGARDQLKNVELQGGVRWLQKLDAKIADRGTILADLQSKLDVSSECLADDGCAFTKLAAAPKAQIAVTYRIANIIETTANGEQVRIGRVLRRTFSVVD
ncbi:MAG: hypothetical protein H6707_16715 [Deltaproteobacteria bacterium]|nr:hypothetical protein [Deltaproteobacteria bacterium]